MEDMNKVLGLGEKYSNFPDKKERNIYPITMRNFQEFVGSFGMINAKKMWVNYLHEETAEAVKKVISMSFRDEKDLDTLYEQINAENFSDIISVIEVINGFQEIGKEDPNQMEV